MKSLGIALIVLLAFTSIVNAQIPPSFAIDLPGQPFGVVASKDEQWIFVSLHMGQNNGGIAILKNSGGQIHLVRVIPMGRVPCGIVLTHNDDMLIAAAQDSVVFFDTQRLETGESHPTFQRISDGPEAGCIYVNVTADDKTLFVSDEFAATITVIDLDKIRAHGRNSVVDWQRVNSDGGALDAVIGRIPVGGSPIALTFSKDQRWLFTTSEIAPPSWGWPLVLRRENGIGMAPEGAVIVIEVAKAKTNPPESIVGRIPAGGSPVRLALSPDGSRLFVSARNSNAVLIFNAHDLVTNPDHAKPIKIPVGTSPVPVALVKNGELALVGNSDRFSLNAMKNSTLTVLNTSLIGTPNNPKIGEIPCGAFPREFYLTSDGRTLFLTNYRSRTLQVIDVNRVMEILER